MCKGVKHENKMVSVTIGEKSYSPLLFQKNPFLIGITHHSGIKRADTFILLEF